MSATAGRDVSGLRRRLVLTIRHLGWRTALWRVVSFPLRYTPLRTRLNLGTAAEQHLHAAVRWFKTTQPSVTVLAPGAALTAPAGHDVAVLDPGLEPDPNWLAVMAYEAHEGTRPAIATGLVLAADGSVESAGLQRAGDELQPRTADTLREVPGPVLAAPETWAYIRSDALTGDSVAEASLRAWEGGHSVAYLPAATARRVQKEGRSPFLHVQKKAPSPFLRRLDDRPVHTPDGKLRIVYVTQETTVGGGHRDIFEHVNRLRARGHDVDLFSLQGQPDWFDLDVEVKQFADWDALVQALAPIDAIKIATWWNTAIPVWRASRAHGLPVYFVQDVETSYYPDDAAAQARVLDTYRTEFAYLTISGYNRDTLAGLGVGAEVGGLGIDLGTFKPLPAIQRSANMLLAIGRGNPLKNLDLTIDAWKALGADRPELTLFGIEPELGRRHGTQYLVAPSDEEVNELLNQATIFIQTSRHEGFALPPLEAMATGGAVVCTDAHGNRDFCIDGVNCLMPAPTVPAVRDAIQTLLDDPELRRRLGEAGRETAARYAWERCIDQLEAFLAQLADRPV